MCGNHTEGELQMRRLTVVIVVALGLAVAGARPETSARAESTENATARRLIGIREEPLALLAFLREMPKGGDLHNHLSGAVYAESFLRWSAEDRLCLTRATFAIVACGG